MKTRLILGIALLAAYPLTAGVLITLHQQIAGRLSMTQVDLMRLVAALASFGGLAVLIGEFQAWKYSRNTRKDEKRSV